MELTKAGLSTLTALKGAASAPVSAAAGPNFADVLKGMLAETAQAQHTAANLTTAVASGQNVAVHEVVAAISKAELTLQTLVTVRDKAVEAYQEIMRMPV